MSRIPQPLVLATKVALECLLDRQKWRRSTVQRLRKPGWMVHQQDDLGHLWIFLASEELWRNPPAIILWRILWKTPENLRPFYSKPMICVFGTRQAPTSYQNYLPPMRWRPESPEAPKTLAIANKKTYMHIPKSNSWLPWKNDVRFLPSSVGSSPKIPREGPTATISPFSGERAVRFWGGSGALSFEKIGCVRSFEETFPIHNHHLLVLGNILKVVFQSRNSSCF